MGYVDFHTYKAIMHTFLTMYEKFFIDCVFIGIFIIDFFIDCVLFENL